LSVVEEIEGVEPSNYFEAIISVDDNNWMIALQDEMESKEERYSHCIILINAGSSIRKESKYLSPQFNIPC
jgi:hypothetical protein